MESGGNIDATHHVMLREGEENWIKYACRVSEPLAASIFPMGKVRTGHMRRMNVLVRVLFISQKNIVAVGKSEVTTTKEQRTTQAGCTTASTEGRAHRTAHLQLPGNPQPAYISSPSDGCSLLTALWLARHKKCRQPKRSDACSEKNTQKRANCK